MTSIIVHKGRASLAEFLQNNSVGECEIFFIDDQKNNISQKINSLIRDRNEDFLLIAVSDVVIPDGWLEHISRSAERVLSDWPSCVAVTSSGVSVVQHGYGITKVIDYLIEGGYQGVTSIELPVTSSTSELVIVDLRKLRASLPSGFSGFLDSDFDVWFCLELALNSLHVVASPIMSAFLPNGHRRGRVKSQPSAELLGFVAKKANLRTFATIRGDYSVPFSGDFDVLSPPPSLDTLFLGVISTTKSPPTLTVITRTQFKRTSELNRCLDSVMSFAAHYGRDSLNLVLTSESHPPQGFLLPDGYQFIQAEVPQQKDSRFLLVGQAVSEVVSDYYLFVDDDDWMFPNNASLLRKVLSICPPGSIIFTDSRHYIEDRKDESGVFVGTNISNGRFFPGNLFMRSLSGVNHNPFCSVVFPRKTFEDIGPEVYSSVEYAEDYFLILKSLYQESLPVVLEGQLVGISIRESGNTVTDYGNPKWLRAKANVAYSLANAPNLSKGKFVQAPEESGTRALFLMPRVWRTLFDGRLLKVVFRYGILGKILSGQISPKFALSKLVSLIKRGW